MRMIAEVLVGGIVGVFVGVLLEALGFPVWAITPLVVLACCIGREMARSFP